MKSWTSKRTSVWRRLRWPAAATVLAATVVCMGSWIAVEHAAEQRLFDDAYRTPRCRVALVLGTAPTVADGHTNLYFRTRVQAAAALWKAGRIQKVLVSGDNSRKDYDEPSAMRDALIAEGVPADSIVRDYAGFDTYDSMVRARDIWGLDSVIVVSQPFHSKRAITIGQSLGQTCFGFSAPLPWGKPTFWATVREAGARVKMVWDLWTNPEPHFRGPREVI